MTKNKHFVEENRSGLAISLEGLSLFGLARLSGLMSKGLRNF